MAQLPSKVVALHSPQRAIILQLQAVGEVLLMQGQQLVSVSHDRGVGRLETVLQGRVDTVSCQLLLRGPQCSTGTLGLVNAAPMRGFASLGQSHLPPSMRAGAAQLWTCPCKYWGTLTGNTRKAAPVHAAEMLAHAPVPMRPTQKSALHLKLAVDDVLPQVVWR